MNTRFYSAISLVAVASVLFSGCAVVSTPTTSQPTAVSPIAVPPTRAPSPISPLATPPGAPSGPSTTLTVMTHDSFAASAAVLQSFERQYNVKLEILKSGDAGTATNKAILAKDHPLADVFYGVDNTFLSRALDAGIFEPYMPQIPADQMPPAQFWLDTANPPRVTPVDYGDVCINYDKAYFQQKGLLISQTLEDLTKPEYNGLLVVENPATSSPGLAFMLATVAHFGPDKFLDYWKQLKANDVKVDDGWEAAYYTDFSGSSGKGPRPLVVSYASSPPAEVVFAKTPPAQAPTGSIIGDDTCFRQIEFVGVLKGAKHPELARKFVDFMLSVKFQEDMPLQMFVFPVNPQAKLPDAFVKYAQVPPHPATLPPQDIAQNRDKWIQEWTQTMLR
jgi:thiamine transport system substrate-binding protein